MRREIEDIIAQLTRLETQTLNLINTEPESYVRHLLVEIRISKRSLEAATHVIGNREMYRRPKTSNN